MSGIYIIGMEMPKRCSQCRFLYGDTLDGLCSAAEKWLDDDDYWTWYVYPEGDMDDSKPCNCPLIPVPDHGRLIDADAMCERLLSAWDTADKEKKTLISDVMARVVTPIVVGTPTIIPATAKEDGE